MAHVHYQFITQPSATFPLRPRSRFPSFLGSSTPSFLLLAIRPPVGGQRGRTVGAGESEMGKKTEWEEKKGRRGEQEKKRRTSRNDHDQRNVAMVSSGRGAIRSRLLRSCKRCIHVSPPVSPLQSRCMPRMQPATRASKNGVHVQCSSFVVSLYISV